MGALLELRGIRRTYLTGEVETHALDGVDLSVESGEVLALLGPSGSGKTTMLNIIAALDVPTAGEYRFERSAVPNDSVEQMTTFRRENVGYIFQSYNLLHDLTAIENVMLVQELSGERDQAAALALLEEVGLSNEVDRYPVEMSGGQQQRVAVARALAKRPRLLLGDEPTGNLDSDTTHQVMRVLMKACRRHDITAIFVTHDATLIRYATRVLHLGSGKLTADEPAPSLIDAGHVAEDVAEKMVEVASATRRALSGAANLASDAIRSVLDIDQTSGSNQPEVDSAADSEAKGDIPIEDDESPE